MKLTPIKLGVFFIIGLLVGAVGTFTFSKTHTIAQQTEIKHTIPKTEFKVRLPTLAVNSKSGEGVIIPLTVEARPGSGRVLTDIEDLLFWVDTQYSIQVAKNLAENLTGKDLSSTDLVYQVDSKSIAVSGESAGAALAVATIATITRQVPKTDVAITGTIDERGVVGRIGGVVAKARAAEKAGITVLLVPKGQSELYELRPIKKCKYQSGWEVCTITYQKKYIDLNITITEVSNIWEVLPYFGIKL